MAGLPTGALRSAGTIERVVGCLLIWMVLPTVLSGCVDSKAVTVHREKLFAQKFDSKLEGHRKKDRHHHCLVNANTCWDFTFDPHVAVVRTKTIKEAKWYTVTVKVKHVAVYLALPFDMWLPENASEEVVAHEDAHVRICKRFYRDAAHQARKCALHILDRQFCGEAKDEETAIKLATAAAAAEVEKCYDEKIVEPAVRASEAFDRLTADKKNQLAVPEAIEKAIAEAQ